MSQRVGAGIQLLGRCCGLQSRRLRLGQLVRREVMGHGGGRLRIGFSVVGGRQRGMVAAARGGQQVGGQSLRNQFMAETEATVARAAAASGLEVPCDQGRPLRSPNGPALATAGPAATAAATRVAGLILAVPAFAAHSTLSRAAQRLAARRPTGWPPAVSVPVQSSR